MFLTYKLSIYNKILQLELSYRVNEYELYDLQRRREILFKFKTKFDGGLIMINSDHKITNILININGFR